MFRKATRKNQKEIPGKVNPPCGFLIREQEKNMIATKSPEQVPLSSVSGFLTYVVLLSVGNSCVLDDVDLLIRSWVMQAK